jgi:hypothetical protein
VADPADSECVVSKLVDLPAWLSPAVLQMPAIGLSITFIVSRSFETTGLWSVDLLCAIDAGNVQYTHPIQ